MCGGTFTDFVSFRRQAGTPSISFLFYLFSWDKKGREQICQQTGLGYRRVKEHRYQLQGEEAAEPPIPSALSAPYHHCPPAPDTHPVSRKGGVIASFSTGITEHISLGLHQHHRDGERDLRLGHCSSQRLGRRGVGAGRSARQTKRVEKRPSERRKR